MTRYEHRHFIVADGNHRESGGGDRRLAHRTPPPAAGCSAAGLSDIGALNRIAVLRGFAEDASCRRARPHAQEQQPVRLRRVTDASSGSKGTRHFPTCRPSRPARSGRSTEIRTYVLKSGGDSMPTFEGWAEKLPGRLGLSKLVVAMYALDGVPRSRISGHTPAPTTGRASVPSRCSKVSGRRKSAVWLTPEMQSTDISTPTGISPLK